MSTIIMNIIIIMAIIFVGAYIVFMLATLIFSGKTNKKEERSKEEKDVKEEIKKLEVRQKEIYNKLFEMSSDEKKEEPVEEKSEEIVEEKPIKEEATEEPAPVEVVEEPIVIEETMSETTEAEEVTEEKKKIPTRRRTFGLKLASSTEATKRYFSEITNRLRYYGLTARIGKSKVMFRANKEVYARMFFKGKRIVLALPLDPNDKKYDTSEYKQIDLSSKKGFENLSFGIRIANKKSVELIKTLIDNVANKFDFKPNEKYKEIDYVEKYPDIYSYFEKLGYGYLLKAEVRKDDVEKFADEFAEKIIIEKKLEDNKPSRLIKSEISIQEFNNRYTDVETPVDMDRLKASELIAKNSNYLIVKASSRIDKPFKVYAHEFEPDAVKMIFMVGGEAIKLEYNEENN